MKKTVNWGLLGCGNIANLFAGVLSTVDEATIYAVAARSGDRASAFKEKHGAVKAYGSYLELVRDPEVDIVYVATVNALHYEHIMLCLENGKPVLCEKPFTLNATEARSVFAKAKEKGLFCMEGMWTSFLPTMRDLFRYIHEEKVIGDVVMAKAELMFDNANGFQERHFDKSTGGGALIDTGVYAVKFACMALGYEPVSIKASAGFKNGCDSTTTVIAGYEDGRTGIMTCSLSANGRNDAWIYGTRGYAQVPLFWRAQKATIYVYDPEDIKVNTFNPKCEVIEISYPHEPPAKGYDHEVRHIHECIRGGIIESPVNTWERTVQVMSIMDAARADIGLVYQQEE